MCLRCWSWLFCFFHCFLLPFLQCRPIQVSLLHPPGFPLAISLSPLPLTTCSPRLSLNLFSACRSDPGAGLDENLGWSDGRFGWS
ncbi:hypothetical protein BKA80DRAFT_139917 [Phyllosticta citrichinensis]